MPASSTHPSPCDFGPPPKLGSVAVIEALEEEMGQLSEQLSRTFEELTLIHDLSRCTKLSNNRATHCREALMRLADCLPLETLVVLLPPDDCLLDSSNPLVTTDYSPLCAGAVSDLDENVTVDLQPSVENAGEIIQIGHKLDQEQLLRIVAELEASSQMVINHPLRCAPNFDRVAMVELEAGSSSSGKLLGVGARPIAELGTIEIQLMQSVGMILNSQLAIHRQFVSVRRMFEGAVRALVSAVDAKDPYTCGHSTRVAAMGKALAADFGLSHEAVDTVHMSGLLHDIGKIGVSDTVLRKPGKLTNEEFDEIKKHPELGYRILRGVPQFVEILPGVRYHHEAWDGSGYPAGLAGVEIPLIARILAVADSFDAMTSTRPYRNGLPLAQVIEIFRIGSGKQWDPVIVSLLLQDRDRLTRMVEDGCL